MERNGVKVVATVEIDKSCNKVLARHFPNATQFTDIQQVTGKDLINAGFDPSNGIITGGFPCQDLSVAGKRAGLSGARSGLFWEIRRLMEETESKWFVLENVPGLLSSNGGKDFGIVLREMADLRYSVGWRVLDAQYFGVPQRRRRVFIVGCRSGNGEHIRQVLFEREGVSRNSEEGRTQGQGLATSTARSTNQAGN
jgi:DNA (cytosine-5)-methyltransferase 1